MVPTAARHGLDVIEIALLNPDAVDASHTRALFEAHGVAPTCSLGLPPEACAPLHPEQATAFLLNALDVAHALGSNTLTGVTYWADSIGRRNISFLNRSKGLVQGLGGRSPAERLSRPGIKGVRHGQQVVGAMRCEIRALREVLA